MKLQKQPCIVAVLVLLLILSWTHFHQRSFGLSKNKSNQQVAIPSAPLSPAQSLARTRSNSSLHGIYNQYIDHTYPQHLQDPSHPLTQYAASAKSSPRDLHHLYTQANHNQTYLISIVKPTHLLAENKYNLFGLDSEAAEEAENPSNPPEVSQPYVVRMKVPNTDKQQSTLNGTISEKAQYVIFHYIPHGSFLLLPLPGGNETRLVSTLSKSNHVISFHPLSQHSKFTPSFFEDLTSIKNNGESEVEIAVSLWGSKYYPSSTKLHQNIHLPEGISLIHNDERLLIFLVDLELTSLQTLSSFLWSMASLPQIEFLHIEQDFTTANFHATALIQSGKYDREGTPFKQSRSAWAMGLTGEGQVLTMGDTGVAHNLCFFADEHVPLPINEINHDHRKIVMYMATKNKSYDVPFGNGHGTHTAATACGSVIPLHHQSPMDTSDATSSYPSLFTPDSDLSHNEFTPSSYPYLARYNGIAPGAKLAIFDFNDGLSPNKIKVPKNLYDGYYEVAYKAGARISSNSWGGRNASYIKEARETDRFSYDFPDFLAIFASGNYGQDGLGTVIAPGTSKNSLSIGSVRNAADQVGCGKTKENGDEKNYKVMSPFSGRGPTPDYRIKPELVTAGETVLSARSPSYELLNGETQSFNPVCQECLSSLLPLFGTSMSTALAAGAGLLIRQYFEQGYHHNGVGRKNLDKGFSPSGSLVKAMLIQSGQPNIYDPYESRDIFINSDLSPSVRWGFGRIQLDQVLQTQGSPFKLWTKDKVPISTSEVHNYCFRVAKGSDFKTTMVYADPPSLPLATFLLINNLDLSASFISAKSNTTEVLLGNLQTVGDAAVRDQVNNVEQITINRNNIQQGSEESSFVAVHVSGANIPHGPQTYALVVTGDAEYEPDASKCSPLEAICPEQCGGAMHGICNMKGHCECRPGYTGDDCMQEIQELACDQALTESVPMASFKYFAFNVSNIPEDNTLDVFFKRLAGESDLYLAHDLVPNLSSWHDALALASGDDSQILRIHNPKQGVYHFGVFGYCCETESSFEISACIKDGKQSSQCYCP